jgi:hypothetical protein
MTAFSAIRIVSPAIAMMLAIEPAMPSIWTVTLRGDCFSAL